jgi:hypothetical protein
VRQGPVHIVASHAAVGQMRARMPACRSACGLLSAQLTACMTVMQDTWLHTWCIPGACLVHTTSPHLLYVSASLPACPAQVAVKLLTVDAEDPSVLDAFLKEVALCACLRGSSRVVRLLGACLGGSTSTAQQQQQQQEQSAHQLSVSSATSDTAGAGTCDAAQATPFASAARRSTDSQVSCPSAEVSGEATAAGATCSSSSHAHQEQQQLALVMELVEGGNLLQRIYHPSKRRLSYLEVCSREAAAVYCVVPGPHHDICPTASTALSMYRCCCNFVSVWCRLLACGASIGWPVGCSTAFNAACTAMSCLASCC